MKITVLAALVAFIILSDTHTARVPVVVELFTSEGCSSCPPADDLLTTLAKEQPVAGAEVIPLEMHVDYWDRQGWKDPASLPLATQRQQTYGRIRGEDRVYTPQAVVDGRDEVVGSDESGLQRTIARAARQPHAHVTARVSADRAAIVAEITVSGVPEGVKEPLDVLFIVTEDGLTSAVKGGENGGRTLHHNATVRAVYPLPSIIGQAPVRARATLNREWRRDRLHAVVVLQGHKTQRIWGATTTPLH